MPVATTQRGVAAAPGYPQYQNTFMIPPIMSDRMLAQFYCDSIYTQISSTDGLNEVIGKGDTIYFLKEPCIGIREYVKDGVLTYDTLEADTCKFTIGAAKYFGIKIDRLDEQLMANWNRYLDSIKANAARTFAQRVDCEMMGQIVSEVDCNNKGPNAGVVSHGYDLGTPGSPFTITPDTIIKFLAYMQAVLDEQCVPEAGRYIVLPPEFRVMMFESELRSACFLNCGTGVSMIANGSTPMELMGFKFIFSNCAPRVLDTATNAYAYYVIAGLPMATAFGSWANMSAEMRDKDNPYERYISALFAYGFAVLYPQALALGYIRF